MKNFQICALLALALLQICSSQVIYRVEDHNVTLTATNLIYGIKIDVVQTYDRPIDKSQERWPSPLAFVDYWNSSDTKSTSVNWIDEIVVQGNGTTEFHLVSRIDHWRFESEVNNHKGCFVIGRPNPLDSTYHCKLNVTVRTGAKLPVYLKVRYVNGTGFLGLPELTYSSWNFGVFTPYNYVPFSMSNQTIFASPSVHPKMYQIGNPDGSPFLWLGFAQRDTVLFTNHPYVSMAGLTCNNFSRFAEFSWFQSPMTLSPTQWNYNFTDMIYQYILNGQKMELYNCSLHLVMRHKHYPLQIVGSTEYNNKIPFPYKIDCKHPIYKPPTPTKRCKILVIVAIVLVFCLFGACVASCFIRRSKRRTQQQQLSVGLSEQPYHPFQNPQPQIGIAMVAPVPNSVQQPHLIHGAQLPMMVPLAQGTGYYVIPHSSLVGNTQHQQQMPFPVMRI